MLLPNWQATATWIFCSYSLVKEKHHVILQL
jgi:hypothetical protein